MDSLQPHGWLNLLAKTRSGSAVKHLRIFLRSIMREAFEQDYIRRNPARMLRVPKLKSVAKAYFTLAQIKEPLKVALRVRPPALREIDLQSSRLASRASLAIIRCPGCGLGDEFRLRVVRTEGWLQCENCGHNTVPLDPDFKCSA